MALGINAYKAVTDSVSIVIIAALMREINGAGISYGPKWPILMVQPRLSAVNGGKPAGVKSE